MPSSAFLPDIAFMRRLAAAAAAQTLPRFRTAHTVDNKFDAEDRDSPKGWFDPVTEADREAERALRAIIGETYPDHGILGEEHGTEGADREHVWIIDPIDGTRAFITGLPVWGTLVGLTVGGVARAGFMSQPFTGELFVADGEASWLEHAGQRTRLATRKGRALADATLFTTTPKLFRGAQLDAWNAIESRVKLSRYGCDCYAYAMLAAGSVDLVIEPALQSYDIAALIPVIEQAGGVVTTWSGGRAEGGGDIIAAATPELHAAAMEIFAGAAGA